ncbi:MAG: glycosyltransferase [Thermoanaerobaculia bacterium]|nr:glycosyltransferase [Thermoanaerobaculia bacterium]
MRILFVGDPYCVHSSRWIHQLRDTGWDIHLFDPTNALIHLELEGITLHTGWKKKDVPRGTRVCSRWPFTRGRHFLQRRLPMLWSRILPPPEERLARLIEQLSPDCVHSLGLRDYATPVVRAAEQLDGGLEVPWIFSCRGSDIFYFRRTPQEVDAIRKVLAGCDYFLANCERDVSLAGEYGLRGEVLGLFQGGGGYPVDEMVAECPPGPPSARKAVAVKGLETVLGRALLTIEALRRCADLLQDHRILFHQCRPETVEAAEQFSRDTGIEIEILPRVHYRKVWSYFGRARLSIAVSLSDGIPNAMLESMIMGALPIQTDPGGATAEWIEDDTNGLLVPPDDADAVASAIRRGLQDDALVDEAAEINRRLARERLDYEMVRDRVIEMYHRVVDR